MMLDEQHVGPLPDPFVGPRWMFAWHEMQRLGWGADTILTHGFLSVAFGFGSWEQVRLDAEARQGMRLQHFLPFKRYLLEQHSIMLRAERNGQQRSIGYRVLSADEQVRDAPGLHAQRLKQAFRGLRRQTTHVRFGELSAEGRQALESALAYREKVHALFGQARRYLPDKAALDSED